MNSDRSIFDVRYVCLHLEAAVTEDCVLPASKASALRGGMGEMLLRANCIRDRACRNCDFREDCVVQRILYSPLKVKPCFEVSEESAGYVLACEDYRKYFSYGDVFSFRLYLFGRTILYLNQILQAFYALGQSGLGSEKARFVIISVKNTKNQQLLNNGNIYMKYYQIQTLGDYIEYRMRKLQEKSLEGRMVFQTPLCQKYKGEYLQYFDMEAIVKSAQRRLYMLDCLEGIEGEAAYRQTLPVPAVIEHNETWVKTMRYSARKDQMMPLIGIKGYVLLDAIPVQTLPYLLAGEVMHIGKNTSFGMGGYRLY